MSLVAVLSSSSAKIRSKDALGPWFAPESKCQPRHSIRCAVVAKLSDRVKVWKNAMCIYRVAVFLLSAGLASATSQAIAASAAVGVSVDETAIGNPVDPRIFGVAYGDTTRNGQIGYTVRRWGGNSTTRYNWQVDVHNTANDYYYENIPDSSNRSSVPPVGNSADTFISGAFSGGSQPLLTIPTIGWTPRSDSALNHPYTVGFSVAKYGAQQSVDPFDTNAGNGYHTDGSAITGNIATDSSTAIDQSFETAWMAHLQSVFGTAANGGVRYYTLDNEVMLWNSTHRDVHPNPATYAEIWGNAQTYGAAIKQTEPNARVSGPVTWGYCDLFGSAADNCVTGSDRQAHGDLAFVAWYLQQVCANPLGNGQHVVDYLDLHYYPQGTDVALSDDDSATTAALRLRSLKELYDPTWVSESWISDLGNSDANHYSIPDLIPRAKAWISQYCPGTKLAITEYNWGNDNTTSGAVAQAEALAIFAREGVDLATRWIAPGSGTEAEEAFSIFLNYDNAGGKVQGESVVATSSNVDLIGAYAFHLPGQRTMVFLTNKDAVAHDVDLTFTAAHSGSAKLYGFSGTTALAQIGSAISLSGTALTLSALPPMSANLLVIPLAAVGFEPLVPARMLDTRVGFATLDDRFAGTGDVSAGNTLNLTVLGRGDVPASGITAVVLNVTATNPTAAGFVTVWPAGSPRPNASNLNFLPGQTIPNLVIAKVGSNGQVSLFNSAGNTGLIADVAGYFTTASKLTSLVPTRLLDTRSGLTTIDGQFAGVGAVAGGHQLDLTVAGRGGLPASGIGAVVMNVTATNPTAAGFITAWPTNAARPLASNLNFVPSQTIPNLVISAVSPAGQMSLFNSAGSTDLIADVMGWFPTASELTSLVPARLLDTRPGMTTTDGQFAGGGAITAAGSVDLTVTGRGGVPAGGVGVVVLNVTVTGPTAPGFVTIWPTGGNRPNTSNLNFVPGQTIPNLVIAKVGTGGKVSLFNSSGSTNLVADVVGWFPPAP